jgi:hypothetical protein
MQSLCGDQAPRPELKIPGKKIPDGLSNSGLAVRRCSEGLESASHAKSLRKPQNPAERKIT